MSKEDDREVCTEEEGELSDEEMVESLEGNAEREDLLGREEGEGMYGYKNLEEKLKSMEVCVYVNPVSWEGQKEKNCEYMVSCCFDEEKEGWRSKWSRGGWEGSSGLLTVPTDKQGNRVVEKLRMVLYERGRLIKVVQRKGVVEWELSGLEDEYPRDAWYSVKNKRGKETGYRLRVQTKYMKPGTGMDLKEFNSMAHYLLSKGERNYWLSLIVEKDPAWVSSCVDEKGDSLVQLAVKLGEVWHAKKLIYKTDGECLKVKTVNKETLLHLAASADKKNRSKKMMKLLLKEKKIDVNAKDDQDRTACHVAAKSGHAEVLELLCKAGADTNVLDSSDRTPLMVALRSCSDRYRVAVLQTLFKYGASANVRDENGNQVWEAIRRMSISQRAMEDFKEVYGVHDLREFAYPNMKKIVLDGVCEEDPLLSTQFAVRAVHKGAQVIILSALIPFVVVKATQDEHSEPAWTPRVVAIANTASSLSYMFSSSCIYLIIPYASKQVCSLPAHFSIVVIFEEKAPIQSNPTRPWAYTLHFDGEWGVGSSGGASPHASWTSNPTFSLTVPSGPIKIAVALSQESGDRALKLYQECVSTPCEFGIGYYILLGKGGTSIVDSTKKWANSQDVYEEFELNFERDQLIRVMPCTFEPNQHNKFTLKVFSDVPLREA
ncbi:uncharacterized protein LOC126323277 [Schistocerca gregaria]|uniref:uncharacterized protein LOC126323277 n=1 Tax=Schistocerca gregaria TaxID=7010 RepID=UPI00211DBE77|nr:uncharacterized protein LOC126323277 [Schistocerca gregaria]